MWAQLAEAASLAVLPQAFSLHGGLILLVPFLSIPSILSRHGWRLHVQLKGLGFRVFGRSCSAVLQTTFAFTIFDFKLLTVDRRGRLLGAAGPWRQPGAPHPAAALGCGRTVQPRGAV